MRRRKSKVKPPDFTERVDRWIKCKDPVPAEGRGKRPQIAESANCTVSIDCGRLMEFTDPPGGIAPPPQRNGKSKRGNGQKQLAKLDRLQPLVSMIGNCMTLARTIDSRGLDDVVASLHQAHSKALDHQFGR